jgi:hypothetical protein
MLRFAWDERKNKRNRAKHGVWFEEAQNVLERSACAPVLTVPGVGSGLAPTPFKKNFNSPCFASRIVHLRAPHRAQPCAGVRFYSVRGRMWTVGLCAKPFRVRSSTISHAKSFRMQSSERKVGGTPHQGPIRNSLKSLPVRACGLAFQPFGQKNHFGGSSRPL